MKFDLLKTVDQGGCSAKLPAKDLAIALADLPKIKDDRLLVDIETHDDAGVFKVREDYALIQTTDFFPPVCSDPYDFGQIAAANAMSDVYAMGGQVLTALNIVMFPAKIPLEVLKDILRGGQDKVAEAGGLILGGHTIADEIPKYGLAVTGWIHPRDIVTNAAAKPGDILILTKPLGTGTIISAHKNGLASSETYGAAIENMKLLNREAARIMNKYHIACATDITGFGLAGHALKMALGSKVTLHIRTGTLPVIGDALSLIDMGCIPGASFRNLEYAENECVFESTLDYNHKMLVFDAQTSGGMLMSVPRKDSGAVLQDLINSGYPSSAMIGEVTAGYHKSIIID